MIVEIGTRHRRDPSGPYCVSQSGHPALRMRGCKDGSPQVWNAVDLVEACQAAGSPRLEVQRPLQPTAFFTSATILTSSEAVNSFSAKPTGHIVPSSRFALSLKPNVAYLALNLCALWK